MNYDLIRCKAATVADPQSLKEKKYMVEDSGNAGASTHPMTFGEKAVGMAFNPGGDPQVTLLKSGFAALIDQLNDMKPEYNGKPNERSRMLAIAITELQTAQMWAVKAVTWKE